MAEDGVSHFPLLRGSCVQEGKAKARGTFAVAPEDQSGASPSDVLSDRVASSDMIVEPTQRPNQVRAS